MNSEERTIISLGERPILFLHQRGFATPPCRHGVRCVALAHITSLFTFQKFSEAFRVLLLPTAYTLELPSIVSVVLSLGLDISLQGDGAPVLNRYAVCRVLVKDTLLAIAGSGTLLNQRCSDFPPPLRSFRSFVKGDRLVSPTVEKE